jgi:class 3 adenylate cyclase
MLTRIKALFAKKQPSPEHITGIGVVLISDQCSARSMSGHLSPETLLNVMKDVLSYQTETIVRFGGIIDQFVGSCVVAYWPPKSMPQAVSAASAAAVALMKKNQVGSVCFDMRVSFCASDLAVAALGPAGRQRVQVIGRAYTRANSMQSQILGGGIITNVETLSMMSDDSRSVFEVRGEFAYSMNKSPPNQQPRTPTSGTPAASASAKATADRDAPVAPPPGIAGR